MSTGSIRQITTQKVLKTLSVKGVNHHYLGSNQPHFALRIRCVVA